MNDLFITLQYFCFSFPFEIANGDDGWPCTVKPVLCDLPMNSELWSHKTGGRLIQI